VNSYEVVLATGLDKLLKYSADVCIDNGQLVIVPLRNRKTLGMVINANNSRESFNIKNITKILNYKLSNNNINFLKWFCEYNIIPMGIALKMMVNFNTEDFVNDHLCGVTTINDQYNCKTIELNHVQQNAVDTLLTREDFAVDLIDGVTGSGKTEVYLAVIMQRLKTTQSSQVLILLPEIALTSALMIRFEKYFEIAPYVWHSNTTKTKKREIWIKAISGAKMVVIGARSALFIPFTNLVTIIVDEEHDASYKQNEQGFYNARDMAIVRGKIENIHVILSSATPSLETVHNVKNCKYGCVKLPNRFANAEMPTVNIVDMRQEQGRPIISSALYTAISNALYKKEQTLLFVNQRGYASLSVCKKCGYKWKCENCDVALIEHKHPHNLMCHHCGSMQKLPVVCPECNAEKTRISLGIGTERVAEAIRCEFPNTRCLTLSSDTVNSPKALRIAMDAIYKNDVDIILGTQILAKGHHFPNLTVVGIIEADQGLYGCDLRANERTYQLLDQVSGRAGREKKMGTVFLQTYSPENPLIKALSTHNRDAFYEYEISDRLAHDMPPFATLIAIIISGKEELYVQKTARTLAASFPANKTLQILGPAPAPIAKLRGQYRYRLLIKLPKNTLLQQAIKQWARSNVPSVSIYIDVDPYEFF
jgi:primosomal protein N' (replication factor Y)